MLRYDKWFLLLTPGVLSAETLVVGMARLGQGTQQVSNRQVCPYMYNMRTYARVRLFTAL